MNWHSVLFKSHELTVIELFLRATILYFSLFLSARAMGYRQPGIVTPYNFIMAAGVSHIAASRMVNPESRPIDAMVIIALYTLLNVLLSFIYLKNNKLVSQQPVLLIRNGKVLKENLAKTNFTIHNILSLLRQKNVFSIKNISYAFIESIGQISVSTNPSHAAPSKQLFNVPAGDQILPEVVIYQGEVDALALKKNGLDFSWLQNELVKSGVKDSSKVYLAILESDKTVYVSNLTD